MRILGSIVAPSTTLMSSCDSKITGSGSIRPQIVRDQLVWDKSILLQQLAHEFQRGTLVPPALDQHIKHFITRDTTFKKMSKGDWDSVIRTNLNSVFNMTKQVMDGMVDRGWGRVVNVSSVNGSKGAFGQTNYSAAKAGMHGFTKALALEVARKGVTVNTISPGYIGTKMVMAIPKEVLDTKILPQIPLGRLGTPEEIAGLIIYLCSDEAAFVTGANIAINGGQHMQ